MPGGSRAPPTCRSAISARAMASSPRDRPIVVVCRSGARSAVATEALIGAGFDAYNLEGGMNAWHAAGYELDPPTGTSSDAGERNAGEKLTLLPREPPHRYWRGAPGSRGLGLVGGPPHRYWAGGALGFPGFGSGWRGLSWTLRPARAKPAPASDRGSGGMGPV